MRAYTLTFEHTDGSQLTYEEFIDAVTDAEANMMATESVAAIWKLDAVIPCD
jgi:hypothetical protein